MLSNEKVIDIESIIDSTISKYREILNTRIVQMECLSSAEAEFDDNESIYDIFIGNKEW